MPIAFNHGRRRFNTQSPPFGGSNKTSVATLPATRTSCVLLSELLGTAQTIVEMNDEIQEVETKLSNISRRCNPRLVEKKLDVAVIDEGEDERAIAAQLALLHRCISAGYRLFRKHSSNLLIAKLLVISRLLHKTLSQNSRAPIFLENLRSQLAALRRSLLKRIECRLACPKYSTLEIIETMSAYCLATSSSPTDVLRHFQQVRFEALQSMLLREDPNFINIEKSLKLFIQTLQNASKLVSGSLSDALRKLTALPILDDVEDWSKQAFGTVASGLSTSLERSQNLKEVLLLRRNLLDIWLPVQSSTACHSSVEILQGIRGTVNKQLISTLHAQAKGLTLVGLEILSTITSWSEIEEQIPTPSLWDLDIVFLDFSGGATNFKHEIINRSRGRDMNVLRISRSYTTWLSGIEQCNDLIDELKKIRWEDIIEDEEDEEVLQKTVRILNKDDPDLLQKEYEATLINSFEALQTSLHSALENMTGSHCGRQAAFILRVIREIRERIPRSLSAQDHLFADDLVPKLHDILAAEVSSQVSPYAIIRALGKPQGAGCAGRALWEGNPPLPIQPSPAAFRLLRRLATAMERQGPDLWNPSAVDILKNKLRQTISSCISLDFEKSTHNARSDAKRPIQNDQQPTSETPNGDDSTEATVTESTHKATTQADVCFPEVLRNRKIQLVFDVFYLGEALSMQNSGRPQAEDGISSIVELVKKDIELDDQGHLDLMV
ncbi:predicted protein [Histoplasma mississippiense (nom. inval.)]|uniref:predicted protein n=1 Tax=Ajellomyces capsulatus (strain NAm1 / WU24) TaxID=2059318 RepID=UPI000157C6CA|nr:predicted protein [Histoplasma mississippiense (nom. inval.)]EDN08634.1 predicted protein [Histoplasma mississippiense (nom. inval.)]